MCSAHVVNKIVVKTNVTFLVGFYSHLKRKETIYKSSVNTIQHSFDLVFDLEDRMPGEGNGCASCQERLAVA